MSGALSYFQGNVANCLSVLASPCVQYSEEPLRVTLDAMICVRSYGKEPKQYAHTVDRQIGTKTEARNWVPSFYPGV